VPCSPRLPGLWLVLAVSVVSVGAASRVLDLCGSALSKLGWWRADQFCCVALLSGHRPDMLLGVEAGGGQALLAGLLNVIPNVGPPLSTVFSDLRGPARCPIGKALGGWGLYIGGIQHLEKLT